MQGIPSCNQHTVLGYIWIPPNSSTALCLQGGEVDQCRSLPKQQLHDAASVHYVQAQSKGDVPAHVEQPQHRTTTGSTVLSAGSFQGSVQRTISQGSRAGVLSVQHPRREYSQRVHSLRLDRRAFLSHIRASPQCARVPHSKMSQEASDEDMLRDYSGLEKTCKVVSLNMEM